MQRSLPRIITFVCGMFLAVQYFIPHKNSEKLYETSLDWLIIVGVFAVVLGILSLVTVNVQKIRRKSQGYRHAWVLLAGLVFMIGAGIATGTGQDGLFLRLGYNAILNPITATMFALLAFYIASAAYRAFRARSALATILLLSAIIVMLGRVPAGEVIPGIPWLTDWLINVPNMAAKRAITIGVGLGGSATALKIVLGIEAPHLR
jgi:phosphotransferase system  glucose/maltose/N-acetylglucosamine-specific IIC component